MDMSWILDVIGILGGFITIWIMLDRAFDYFVGTRVKNKK